MRWSDSVLGRQGTENLPHPCQYLASLAFWQLNAFTFHAYNLFSKQHSHFLLFYNDNFELVFSTIFLTNFERSTFPYTRKENQCEPFPAALAAFFFSLFYVGAKLWTANKINCAWFEWNENTNEIPWNPLAGIFRNKTWVLFYGSALF